MSVATLMGGRASHVLPLRTSARRPRNVASPTSPTHDRFKLKATHLAGVGARYGIAALLFVLIVNNSFAAGDSTTRNSASGEFQGGYKNEKVDQLIQDGLSLMRAGRGEEAEQLFLQVIRQDHNATHASVAHQELAIIACLKQKRGRELSLDTEEGLVPRIKQAVLARDTAVLAPYASCDFAVGAKYHHDFWGMNPYEVFPALLDIVPEIIDWRVYHDKGSEATLVLRNDKQKEYFLGLTPEAGGWKWGSILTTDESLLDRLRKRRVEIENLTVKGRGK